MKNGDIPAMPVELNGFGQFKPEAFTGLTKREMFAVAAMQGLLSNPGMPLTGSINVAVEAADLLLRRLDGEDINPPQNNAPNPDWPEMPKQMEVNDANANI